MTIMKFNGAMNTAMINTFKTSFSARGETFPVDFKDSENGTEQTIDYNDLINKPKINGVELQEDKTFEELNLIEVTNQEIDNLFKRL